MLLAREQIEQAFERLNEQHAIEDERAEVFLVGGAVMCLVHHARPSTKDVDGWFSNPQVVRAGVDSWRALSHLTVSHADAPTLLAMKCAASRSEEDARDIRFLAAHLKLDRAEEVLAVVVRYYPEDRLPVRTRLLLEEMFP